MAKLCRELRGQGRNIIDLSLGEPDFDTPVFIKDATKRALDEGYTKYTPVAGFLDLRKAIADKFKRDNHLTFSAEQIVVSTGAKQSIANAVFAMVNEGEEVIVPSPYWVSYREMVKMAGGKLVRVNTKLENEFKLTADELSSAITANTKLFIFSSPCNPTGAVYSKEELHALAKVISAHPQIIVISDEIYEHINFLGHHESIAQFEELKDRVVVVNGCSKGFAMTGWRIGYIGAPLEIAKACEKIQGQWTSGANSLAQRAALAALNGSLNDTIKMRDAFNRRRELIMKLLSDIEGFKCNHPEGAFYVFPDVSFYFGKKYKHYEIKNADDLCMFLLYEGNVSIVTGAAFGDANCVRISYATSDQNIIEAVKRLKTALALLK
ncbi:MAG TPA: aspartate aminotransferase [Bacteroidetes bacterium]|nr:aspartate aminotransferase [Bacteroidota bacterium]